jgi:hypothetical protein
VSRPATAVKAGHPRWVNPWMVSEEERASALGRPRSASFPDQLAAVPFGQARDRWCTMREDFASTSFLAVTVAGLVLLLSGLVTFAFD